MEMLPGYSLPIYGKMGHFNEIRTFTSASRENSNTCTDQSVTMRLFSHLTSMKCLKVPHFFHTFVAVNYNMMFVTCIFAPKSDIKCGHFWVTKSSRCNFLVWFENIFLLSLKILLYWHQFPQYTHISSLWTLCFHPWIVIFHIFSQIIKEKYYYFRIINHNFAIISA